MTSEPVKKRAPRNRTICMDASESDHYRQYVATLNDLAGRPALTSQLVHADAFAALPCLPERSFDLMFADPPYNITKRFGVKSFKKTHNNEYENWLRLWLDLCSPLLKSSASVYVCGDWQSSSAIERVGSQYFKIRNRITWEREKGRGAKANWKNAAEDIWFFTVSDNYTFNLDSVKNRRRVIAPYKVDGRPKDWSETADGKFRDTHPSNLWTDITVPFWSMPENTPHPTQKPEKLLAKILLASTNPKDLILDPFAGSGTSAVVAKKLGRAFVAIEADENHCLIAAKRLEMADRDRRIQGYSDGVFWERNSS